MVLASTATAAIAAGVVMVALFGLVSHVMPYIMVTAGLVAALAALRYLFVNRPLADTSLTGFLEDISYFWLSVLIGFVAYRAGMSVFFGGTFIGLFVVFAFLFVGFVVGFGPVLRGVAFVVGAVLGNE